MKTVNLSVAFGAADKIDEANGILRGVSIMTMGVAKGHGLTVDDVTLDQIQKAALARGKVPSRLNHSTGAENIVGFIENVRRTGNKIVGDLFLLDNHPQRAQLLETARRMPEGFGLSASFVQPENAEPGKARCSELVSIDVVAVPAANPLGLFSARYDNQPQPPLSGLEKVRRVLGAASRGAEIGAVGGLAGRALLRARGRHVTYDGAATTGAAVGALASGVVQWRRDSRPGPRRDLAARVTQRLFEDRATLHRLTAATRENIAVPVPGADEAGTISKIAKTPLARRLAVRALKIGAGAGLGYYAGRKIGPKAGAVTGAVAGLLFSSPEVCATVRRSLAHSKRITNL